MANHIILLGDSIFDNAAYTSGEPDVVGHLRSLLPTPWRATLCAVDGSRTTDLAAQLRKVPSDGSYIMVAVGGNDALGNIDMLDRPVRSTPEALQLFGERIRSCESSYRDAIRGVVSLGRETTVCTIYNGNLDPALAPRARIGLMMFNDVILRVAFELGLNVIDLRLICNETSDYANPIEPSGQGGRKISKAVACAAGALGEKKILLTYNPPFFYTKRL